MTTLDKLIKEGNIEGLAKERIAALSSQDAITYALCSLELGIPRGALEDNFLFERGFADLESRYKIRPQNVWVALNYAKDAPATMKKFESNRDFYAIPSRTETQRKKAGSEARKSLFSMFPTDKDSISKMTDKQALFSYYTIRSVYG